MWAKLYKYPRAKYNSINSILELQRDSTLVLGNLGMSNDWVASIKPNGTITWQKMARSSEFEIIDGTILSKDMFLVVGNLNTTSQDSYTTRRDTAIFALDKHGDILWNVTYKLKRAKTRDLEVASILKANSWKKLYVVGTGELPREYENVPILWKINANTKGKILWSYLYRLNSERFGSNATFYLYGALKGNDNSVFIVGELEYWYEDKDLPQQDIWIMKVNKNGTPVWSKSYGKSGFIFNVNKVIYYENKLILVGDVIKEGQKRFPFIARINNLGKLELMHILKTDTLSSLGYGITISEDSLIVAGEGGEQVYSPFGKGEYGWLAQISFNSKVKLAWKFKSMLLFDIGTIGKTTLIAGKRKGNKEQGVLISIPTTELSRLKADTSMNIRLKKIHVQEHPVSVKKDTVKLTRTSKRNISPLKEGRAVSEMFKLPLLKVNSLNSLKILSKAKTETTKHEKSPNKGYEFETRVANVLRAVGLNARTTQKSRDYGADIILELGSKRIAIQCKDTKKAIGIKAIQEVLGGKAYYRCDDAWVISTGGFTQEAKELARVANVKLFTRISDILRMLGY